MLQYSIEVSLEEGKIRGLTEKELVEDIEACRSLSEIVSSFFIQKILMLKS